MKGIYFRTRNNISLFFLHLSEKYGKKVPKLGKKSKFFKFHSFEQWYMGKVRFRGHFSETKILIFNESMSAELTILQK